MTAVPVVIRRADRRRLLEHLAEADELDRLVREREASSLLSALTQCPPSPAGQSWCKVYGHDVVFPGAVQTIVRPEPQSTRPAETGGAFRDEDAHDMPGDRVVFADARHGVRSAEGPLAGDHDVPVGSELQIQGAQFGSVTK
jgi:hypothetical protein